MKKRLCFALTALCLLVALMIPAMAARQTAPVNDRADFLTVDEEKRIEQAILEASEKNNCAYYMATASIPLGILSDDYSYRYTGEMFLMDNGLSDRENIVLLVVSKQGDTYYYDMYTYGDAYDEISQKEVDYILDHTSVYNAIKSGRVSEGACSFFAMSAEAYSGRVGVSYVIIVIVAAILALIVGAVACGAVYAAYKQKNKSVDYPLNRYANLELTDQKDQFAGTFVTKRVIQTNSGGGGGGSFHGGGGGHRGGR